MNRRDGTDGTATPRPTGHTHALPTAASCQHSKGTIPTEGLSRNQRGTAAKVRRHIAAHTRRESHTGHRLMGRPHAPLGPPRLTRGPDDGRQSSG